MWKNGIDACMPLIYDLLINIFLLKRDKIVKNEENNVILETIGHELKIIKKLAIYIKGK